MTETGHTDIAAYVLGILDEPDNIAFEVHLQACPDCQLDLLELRDLPELLAKVKRRWPGPPVPALGKPLVSLLDEAASTRRKQRRRSRILVAAAAFLIIAGPVVTMALNPARSATPGQAEAQAPAVPTKPAPDVHTGSAASQNGGGVSAQSQIDHVDTINATVSVTPKEWGTQADLELRGITGPLHCRLLAVSYGGEIQVMANWSVPNKGYGVPASPNPLKISGSTGLAAADIERFEVRTDDSLLVTIEHK
jgi:hypothetical protein